MTHAIRSFVVAAMLSAVGATADAQAGDATKVQHAALATALDNEIPMIGTHMPRQFKDRPDMALAQFHRDIGKYVEATDLARLEQYVFVPTT